MSPGRSRYRLQNDTGTTAVHGPPRTLTSYHLVLSLTVHPIPATFVISLLALISVASVIAALREVHLNRSQTTDPPTRACSRLLWLMVGVGLGGGGLLAWLTLDAGSEPGSQLPVNGGAESGVSEIAVAIAVGVATGLISSALVWYSLTHRFLPNVQLASEISVFAGLDGTRRCQLKYRNEGRRPAYDIEVSVSVGINNLITSDAREWTHITTKRKPFLHPGEERRFTLWLDDATSFRRFEPFLPEDLRTNGDGTKRIPLVALFEHDLEVVVRGTITSPHCS